MAGRRLEVLLDVTRRLMTVTDLDALLRLIAEATTSMVEAERATIYVVDRDTQEYWSRVALGAGIGEIRFPIGVGIAGAVAKTGETINIADAYADRRFNPESDRRSGFRTRNLLTLPMTSHDGSIIGVFQAVNKRDGAFAAEDVATLASLASSAAVAVENAQLVSAQRRLWQSLIETLATTVDARDQQTAGHSKRVTRYAGVIGAELGLTSAELDRLQAAALLHDYGKIAVRDRFLQKPGKLDDAEFAYMKAHAEKTGEFLAYLQFPPDMREVPLIAAQHHERMDGTGYPKGLSGDAILVGARIVAAADVFDALTAPRYYKPAYTLEKTLEIMDGMAGSHLDPAVVTAVHRALPELERTIGELKSTWPKPGDEGMGSIQEAVSGLSERDRPAAGAASA
ncbi:MAG TPA: HD domain-containing phosphohydrolase [Candidatus Limnocylindria bacterium]|nr:HD domain-containing phosphohydrolase [Candidatus Limnocylindria bacterium]